MKKIAILAAAAAVGFAGTAQAAPNSVDYYRANPAARNATLTRCNKDPERLRGTTDCVNARTAAGLGASGSSRPTTFETGKPRYVGKSY